MKNISSLVKKAILVSTVAAVSSVAFATDRASAAEFSWDFSVTYGGQNNLKEGFGSFTFDDSIASDYGYALTSFSWNGEEKTVYTENWSMDKGFGEVILDENNEISEIGFWVAEEDIDWTKKSMVDFEYNYFSEGGEVYLWNPNQEEVKTPRIRSISFSRVEPESVSAPSVPEPLPGGMATTMSLLAVGGAFKVISGKKRAGKSS